MLPKGNRAGTKQVEKIFKEGRFLNSHSLTFKYNLTKIPPTRISFIAPKSIARLAVKRNLLRRRGYSALRKYIPDLPAGTEGVFIFKKPEADISVLDHEIKEILHKIN